jgi:hypothetical protein
MYRVSHAKKKQIGDTCGRNFSVLRYEPILKIDPYQRKAWNSAKEIERRF